MVTIVKNIDELESDAVTSLAALCIDTRLADVNELSCNDLTKKLVDSIIRDDIHSKMLTAYVTPISQIYCYHEDDEDCICKRTAILRSMRGFYKTNHGYRQAVSRLFYPEYCITVKEDGKTHINISQGARTEIGITVSNILNLRSPIHTYTKPYMSYLEVFLGSINGEGEIVNQLSTNSNKSSNSVIAKLFVEALPDYVKKAISELPISYYNYRVVKDEYILSIDPTMFKICELIKSEIN